MAFQNPIVQNYYDSAVKTMNAIYDRALQQALQARKEYRAAMGIAGGLTEKDMGELTDRFQQTKDNSLMQVLSNAYQLDAQQQAQADYWRNLKQYQQDENAQTSQWMNQFATANALSGMEPDWVTRAKGREDAYFGEGHYENGQWVKGKAGTDSMTQGQFNTWINSPAAAPAGYERPEIRGKQRTWNMFDVPAVAGGASRRSPGLKWGGDFNA